MSKSVHELARRDRARTPPTSKILAGQLYILKGKAVLGCDWSASATLKPAFAKQLKQKSRSAKWSELRATTCLARMLRDTNRRDEARAMLADIYNWFTEGFDLPDLKEAKALLDEPRN